MHNTIQVGIRVGEDHQGSGGPVERQDPFCQTGSKEEFLHCPDCSTVEHYSNPNQISKKPVSVQENVPIKHMEEPHWAVHKSIKMAVKWRMCNAQTTTPNLLRAPRWSIEGIWRYTGKWCLRDVHRLNHLINTVIYPCTP